MAPPAARACQARSGSACLRSRSRCRPMTPTFIGTPISQAILPTPGCDESLSRAAARVRQKRSDRMPHSGSPKRGWFSRSLQPFGQRGGAMIARIAHAFVRRSSGRSRARERRAAARASVGGLYGRRGPMLVFKQRTASGVSCQNNKRQPTGREHRPAPEHRRVNQMAV